MTTDRKTIARLGGLARAASHSSVDLARKGQAGLDARFLREVDPNGVLSEVERARRADAAKRAHFTRLALASAKARAITG